MAKKNTFTKRDGSTFNCGTCGRRTRHTGAQSLGSKLCPQCFDLAGIDNEISDGHASLKERRDEIDALLRHIEQHGGDTSEWTHLMRPSVDEVPDNAYVSIIRCSNEPTKAALEMLRAVEQHLQDLRDDDPGDNDRATMSMLNGVGINLNLAVKALEALTK